MKKIIDGIEYDTETATPLATQPFDKNTLVGIRFRGIAHFMRTPDGRYFIHDEGESFDLNAVDPEGPRVKWKPYHDIRPVQNDEAEEILQGSDWER